MIGTQQNKLRGIILKYMTPLKYYPRLSSELGINLSVKHDDYFPFTGGGNKARKIDYILKMASTRGTNALVTAGAANSNHARVVALAAAQLGWKCKLIIHDQEDYSNGNLLMMRLAGAELIFVEQINVASAMDEAMQSFTKAGLKPFYIFGGGHSVEGSLAYYDAFKEFVSQSGVLPDYIVHASGTGTTQAGLHVGAELTKACKTKIIGISVARDKLRGAKIIKESADELHSFLFPHKPHKNLNEVSFYDDWNAGGYGHSNQHLIETIKWAARTEGLILDPVYTGKAFTGLIDLVSSNKIEKETNVVFWHTGGLINLMNTEKKVL